MDSQGLKMEIANFLEQRIISPLPLGEGQGEGVSLRERGIHPHLASPIKGEEGGSA